MAFGGVFMKLVRIELLTYNSRYMEMNKILLAIIALLIIGGGVYFVKSNTFIPSYEADKTDTSAAETVATESEADTVTDESEEEQEVVEEENEGETALGTSVEGRDITAYHFGEGEKEVVFVGGIHGGYSWNTALVAYQLIDYLRDTKDAVPEGVKVTVIPALNPDGLKVATGEVGKFRASDVSSDPAVRTASRFNANEVDLNRNFDCEWNAEATWQSRDVSGGSEPFSEPESAAFKAYIDSAKPAAVVAWYSAAGGVYASNCKNGILPETTELMDVYADASGYKAYSDFDFYEVTGDMVNWLAAESIPAISVLLTTHADMEWEKNIAGIQAILNNYKE